MNRLARLKACLVGAIVALSAGALAVQQILIAQTRIPFKDQDPNLPIANLIASQFDELAKLDAVVWGMSDPTFRDAIASRRITNVPELPTQKAAMQVASQLGAEYVLLVEAKKDGPRVAAKIDVFQSGRSIYKDDQNLTVTKEDVPDIDASLRSLARTLVVRLNAGPLKYLPVKARAVTPDPGKGQLPDVHPESPLDPANPVALLAQAKAQQAAGKLDNAMLLLRDGIDANPFNVPLRSELIRELTESDAVAAASEARRAAALMPGHPELRLSAAQAWLRAGNPEEAHNDLNEALARNPEDVSTLVLVGDVNLEELKPEDALAPLNRALTHTADPDALFLRSLGFSLVGRMAASDKDYATYTSIKIIPSPIDLAHRYGLAAEVLDRALIKDSGEVRSIMQQGIVHPTDPKLKERVQTSLRRARARAKFADDLQCPVEFKSVQQQRILANRLMVQALVDVERFLSGATEDSLYDSRIDLGEAIRNGTETRQAEARIRAKKN